MGTVLPFELFGTCRSGVPITFVGLGRMDLTGIQREIGLDRLEQKMVMQNDAFIDLARREGLRRSSEDECVVAHGGVFVIDCDGFGRRHLGEVRIFKRCAAALKVLHPERQRKTFVAVHKSKFHGAIALNLRVVVHAIDATPARWRGDVGSSPLDTGSSSVRRASLPCSGK